MKVALLTLLACVVAANAAFLPQQGVTAHDIDTLVSDSVRYFKTLIIKNQPLKSNDISLPLKNSNLDLQAKLKNVELIYVHETSSSSYSESSSMSNNKLSLSVQASQSGIEFNGKLELLGTLNGKSFEKTGDFKLTMDVGNSVDLKAEFTPKSFKLVDLSYSPLKLKNMKVETSGFDVDQSGKELIEKSLQDSMLESITKAYEANKLTIPSAVERLNKLAEGHNLQEVYDYLRKMVPRSGQKHSHFGGFDFGYLIM